MASFSLEQASHEQILAGIKQVFRRSDFQVEEGRSAVSGVNEFHIVKPGGSKIRVKCLLMANGSGITDETVTEFANEQKKTGSPGQLITNGSFGIAAPHIAAAAGVTLVDRKGLENAISSLPPEELQKLSAVFQSAHSFVVPAPVPEEPAISSRGMSMPAGATPPSAKAAPAAPKLEIAAEPVTPGSPSVEFENPYGPPKNSDEEKKKRPGIGTLLAFAGGAIVAMFAITAFALPKVKELGQAAIFTHDRRNAEHLESVAGAGKSAGLDFARLGNYDVEQTINLLVEGAIVTDPTSAFKGTSFGVPNMTPEEIVRAGDLMIVFNGTLMTKANAERSSRRREDIESEGALPATVTPAVLRVEGEEKAEVRYRSTTKTGRARYNALKIVDVSKASRDAGLDFVGLGRGSVLSAILLLIEGETVFDPSSPLHGTYFGMPDLTVEEALAAAELLKVENGDLELIDPAT